MNRERAKELLPIIQAFADGAEIEWKGGVGTGWRKSSCEFADNTEYRIKPKEPREFWIVGVTNRSDRFPHVLSPKEKERHFADSGRYIKVREVLDE